LCYTCCIPLYKLLSCLESFQALATCCCFIHYCKRYHCSQDPCVYFQGFEQQQQIKLQRKQAQQEAG
jgi:hypothetical protein